MVPILRGSNSFVFLFVHNKHSFAYCLFAYLLPSIYLTILLLATLLFSLFYPYYLINKVSNTRNIDPLPLSLFFFCFCSTFFSENKYRVIIKA